MDDGFGIRRQDRQTVVDGVGQGSVSGDGEARDFAQVEMTKLRRVANLTFDQ